MDAALGRPNRYARNTRKETVVTGSLGEFSHTFPSFLRGQAVWILPPFFLLAARDSPVLVRLPGGRLFEIRATKPEPRIRVYDPARKVFRALRELPHSGGISGMASEADREDALNRGRTEKVKTVKLEIQGF
jgi:hypothetical protein